VAGSSRKSPSKGKAKGKWSDKPKNKLIAFWVDNAYLAKLDNALKKAGISSRAKYLNEQCDKLILKHGGKLPAAKASKPKAAPKKASKPKAAPKKASKPKASKPKASKPKAAPKKASKPKAAKLTVSGLVNPTGIQVDNGPTPEASPVASV
jgi:hypothetical protein